MEELSKQVKSESIRTLLWTIISAAAAGAVYYLVL
jgi:hypothetical protein